MVFLSLLTQEIDLFAQKTDSIGIRKSLEFHDRAKQFRKTGEYRLASQLLDSAISFSADAGYGLRSDLLTEKGINSMYMSNYTDALRFMQEALAVREKWGGPDKLAETYNYIAAVHQIQGNLNIAEDYYRSSFSLIEGSDDKRIVGNVTNNLGSLYEEREDFEKALVYHSKSLDIWRELNDSSWIAVSYLHLGMCYRRTERLEEALIALENAYRSGSRLIQVMASQSTGLVYMDMRSFGEALKWLDLSYQLALKEDNLVKVQECASSLANIHEELGNHQQALSFYQLEVSLKDSIFGKEMTKEITELELNFQFEKEQLADSLEFVRTSLIQEKKISNQRIGLFSTGVITAIMILLAFVVYQGKQRSEKLLLNILPKEVATELKNTGKAKARRFDHVTVIFTDFKGFTEMSEKLSAESLVSEINLCFSQFDSIMTKHGIEKIKTIGDAYMAVSGLPIPKEKHAQSAVFAALEMVTFMKKRKENLEKEGKLGFEMRVGIHSGDVVAGIVGTKKFQYDIWGDTVNMAARMESSGEVSKVNISNATYEMLKNEFQCTPRGLLEVKGKGMVEMFFVDAVNQTASTSVS